ncbi:MAG: tRNA (adenosine(37)-N6)-dimethylallyltransferase MiaA [Planctomycetota bacterium]|jgi:tRNA dimethylallyltransferase
MLLILGATASGKSRLAFNLADHIGAEIVSIDSMKVYRRMDIGTAKPPKEARAAIRHHLIDVVEPSNSYGVGLFLEHGAAAIKKIKRRNLPVVAVGGTALYIKALLYGLFEGPSADESIRKKLQKDARAKGLIPLHRQLEAVDPITAERIHPNDAKRIIRALEVYELTGMPISSLQQQWKHEMNHDWVIIGLRREKDAANRRINSRVKKMIADGLVDEVKSLLAEEEPLSRQARCAIGYAEIIDHLNGKISLQDAIELIKKNTRRLAKNQRTWFRSFENVRWLDIQPEEPFERTLTRAIALYNSIR